MSFRVWLLFSGSMVCIEFLLKLLVFIRIVCFWFCRVLVMIFVVEVLLLLISIISGILLLGLVGLVLKCSLELVMWFLV